MNHAFSGPWSTQFYSIVTWLGHGLVLALIIVPAWYFLHRPGLKKHLLPLIISLCLSGGVVALTKLSTDRPRPPEYCRSMGIVIHVPCEVPIDRSFPSGHTSTAFGTAMYLSMVYPSLTPILMALAYFVGLSRIALGVHYPSDVLVGALLGILFSVIIFRIKRRYY